MPLIGFGVYQMRQCTEPIAAAFKAGYRHIDSAQVYRNEDQVGEAFRASGLKREEVFISAPTLSRYTLAWLLMPDGVATKIGGRNQGYAKASASIDQSLKSLGLDYVDLFLIHDPLSGSTKRLETYKALLEKQHAGLIRSIGVSN
jgi:diketogulonate reductase-like aldo/keto reductase